MKLKFCRVMKFIGVFGEPIGLGILLLTAIFQFVFVDWLNTGYLDHQLLKLDQKLDYIWIKVHDINRDIYLDEVKNYPELWDRLNRNYMDFFRFDENPVAEQKKQFKTAYLIAYVIGAVLVVLGKSYDRWLKWEEIKRKEKL